MRHKINKWKKNKKKEIISLVKRFGPLPAKAPGRASILINLLKLDNKLCRIFVKKLIFKN